ncbi:LacI family DNA-binding transcriptional regulator [Streptosporangium sp. 'caverna']|uniref:LacI family DNA-binding transcriptional regulator n=1 Tax=Streptosporangium sp. 'caverna' TaxID=2202249 RepID=UPI000D7D78E0|nr:LacI family DNA-binding transcriptional regulator [Streptosporangium sp. 'caverna']AWS42461.1 LacI family transcriptional regulator [Streptosporangium sp. 'caverna']
MRRPTIADVARQAGVSKGAVSYALNGQPGVSESTRARIMAIAEEIGWRPNSAARALNGARAGAVGLALCRPARTLGMEPFFMELISGIEGELSARSYALMLQVVGDHQQEVAVYRRWWGEGRVDGAILVDLHVGDPRVAEFEALGLPTVVIGHPSESGALVSVWSDDGGAVRETVEYLVALGHRRIARVAGLPRLVHTALRDRAFAEACEGVAEQVTVHTDYTGEEGARATRRLLSSPDRPTAIVYDNDIMAVAGLSAAQDLRLDVPRDLSIVAWDDSPLSQVVRPPLTALSRDISAYGGHAARRLLALIAGEDVGAFEDEAARLTPRGSTAPPPSGVPHG